MNKRLQHKPIKDAQWEVEIQCSGLKIVKGKLKKYYRWEATEKVSDEQYTDGDFPTGIVCLTQTMPLSELATQSIRDWKRFAKTNGITDYEIKKEVING